MRSVHHSAAAEITNGISFLVRVQVLSKRRCPLDAVVAGFVDVLLMFVDVFVFKRGSCAKMRRWCNRFAVMKDGLKEKMTQFAKWSVLI